MKCDSRPNQFRKLIKKLLRLFGDQSKTHTVELLQRDSSTFYSALVKSTDKINPLTLEELERIGKNTYGNKLLGQILVSLFPYIGAIIYPDGKVCYVCSKEHLSNSVNVFEQLVKPKSSSLRELFHSSQTGIDLKKCSQIVEALLPNEKECDNVYKKHATMTLDKYVVEGAFCEMTFTFKTQPIYNSDFL